MKKIGILTFHWADDFGGMLQTYALKHFINSNHIGQAEIIPYETIALRGRYWLLPYWPKYAHRPISGAAIKKGATSTLKNLTQKIKRIREMRAFRRRHLTTAPRLRSTQDLCDLPYDVIVLGSDQIWNPDITYRLEPAYFGAFHKQARTITLSYAASLGKPALTDAYSKKFRDLIRSVDILSVREETSIPYVQKQSGKPVRCMPDPTLLLSPEEWEQIAILPRETAYVLLHYTEYNEDLVQKAILYAQENRLPVISLRPLTIPGVDIQVRFGIGPAEFLGYIKQASCVFTNSFHATVFSLIFGKDFCCVAHKTLGSRTTDLLARFGIQNADGCISPSAYASRAEAILSKFRNDACTFLRENSSYRKADISSHCKGCGACAAVCPTEAILMKPDSDGFFHPYINEQRCIQCGGCHNVCPDIKPISYSNEPAVYGFKCKSEEIRQRSTSGGIFYLLAEQMIQRGGCVYGAVLNQEHEVCHVCAETMEDILPMQGAKYVESRLDNCFPEIRNRLAKQSVLFTGTPCQIAGLKAFVGDHPNLYTIDIVCHGVASPKAYAKYMRWLEHHGDVTHFSFRDKTTGWHTSSVYYLQNGVKHLERMGKNPYTKLYFRGLLSRKSCHACQYASFDRCADMTIGDFWGVETANPAFDDKKGVSLVILHSEKGRAMFDEVSSNAETFRSNKVDCLQPQLQKPAPKSKQRERFMQELDQLSFETLTKKYVLLTQTEQLKKRIQKKWTSHKK